MDELVVFGRNGPYSRAVQNTLSEFRDTQMTLGKDKGQTKCWVPGCSSVDELEKTKTKDRAAVLKLLVDVHGRW